jgi:hypothetical protein
VELPVTAGGGFGFEKMKIVELETSNFVVAAVVKMEDIR